jgi:hypothetical protein
MSEVVAEFLGGFFLPPANFPAINNDIMLKGNNIDHVHGSAFTPFFFEVIAVKSDQRSCTSPLPQCGQRMPPCFQSISFKACETDLALAALEVAAGHTCLPAQGVSCREIANP